MAKGNFALASTDLHFQLPKIRGKSREHDAAPLCIASAFKNQGEINVDIQLPSSFSLPTLLNPNPQCDDTYI